MVNNYFSFIKHNHINKKMENYNLDIIISAKNLATNVLNNVKTQLNQIAEQGKKTGERLSKSFSKYTLVAAGAIATSIKFAGDFEKNMNNINTLFNDNGEQIKAYKQWILDIIKVSPKNPDELGKASYDIISAWITDTAEALKVLKASNDLAVGWLGSVSEATNILTSSINAFKDQSYTADQQADILFKTVKNGKTTISELAQWFGWIAGLADTAGIKFHELMAATAALTTTWLPASEAYTWLKAAISNILKPGSEAAKTAAELWIEFNSAWLKAKWFSGLLKEIADKTDGDIDLMGKLFNSTEALNSILALTTSSADAFNWTMKDMTEWQKALNIAVKKQNEWFNAQVNILKHQLQASMIEFWNAMLPVIKWINNFMTEHKTLTKVILGSVVVFVWIAGALGAVWMAMTAVSSGVAVLTAALWPLNIALRWLFLNPIWLIIAGIATLLYFIYRLITDFEGVKKSLKQVWNHLISFQGWIKWIGKTLMDFMILPLKQVLWLIDTIFWTQYTFKVDNFERKLFWLKELNDKIENQNNSKTTLNDTNNINKPIQTNSQTQIKQDVKIDINLDNIQVKNQEDIDKISRQVAEQLTEKLAEQNRFNS